MVENQLFDQFRNLRVLLGVGGGTTAGKYRSDHERWKPVHGKSWRRWSGTWFGDFDGMAQLCFGARAASAPGAQRRVRQANEKLCSSGRGGNDGNRGSIVRDSDAVLSNILVICKCAKSRIVEQRCFSWKRHENAITLPLTDRGCEIVWQPGWEKKADVLLIEVLKWDHGRISSLPPRRRYWRLAAR